VLFIDMMMIDELLFYMDQRSLFWKISYLKALFFNYYSLVMREKTEIETLSPVCICIFREEGKMRFLLVVRFGYFNKLWMDETEKGCIVRDSQPICVHGSVCVCLAVHSNFVRMTEVAAFFMESARVSNFVFSLVLKGLYTARVFTRKVVSQSSTLQYALIYVGKEGSTQ